MSIMLVVIFSITLIYLSITERFTIYVLLIGIQGIILFALSLLELNHITLGTLLFVAIETLVFKVIVVPYMLGRIIKKTGLTRVSEHALPGFLFPVVCYSRTDTQYCHIAFPENTAIYPDLFYRIFFCDIYRIIPDHITPESIFTPGGISRH